MAKFSFTIVCLSLCAFPYVMCVWRGGAKKSQGNLKHKSNVIIDTGGTLFLNGKWFSAETVDKVRGRCGGERGGVSAWICHGKIKKKEAWAKLEDCVIGVLLFFPLHLPFPFLKTSLSLYPPHSLFEVYLTCDESGNFIWIDKGLVTCSLTLTTDLEGDEREEGSGNGRYYRSLFVDSSLSYLNDILSCTSLCLCSIFGVFFYFLKGIYMCICTLSILSINTGKNSSKVSCWLRWLIAI